MSDGSSKPGIPAWQRTPQQQPLSDAIPATSHDHTESDAGGVESSSVDHSEAVRAAGMEESDPPSEDTSANELDQVRALLDDPEVKDAALGKKQAYLESKGVPQKVTSDTLGTSNTGISFNSADFDTFKRLPKTITLPSAPSQAQPSSAPPIITYPEFLMEAHKPPPLVTPSRVLTATYIAGGLATLVYGASKYILNPMVDALTESRHDFATHSKTKVDEFNERLSKIVSQVPPTNQGKEVSAPEVEISEVDSVTSDPTELYHRDMGTQTSPLPTRRSSDSDSSDAPATTTAAEKPATTQCHSTALSIIKSHLNELTDGIESSSSTNQERQDNISDLRHYIDTLLYSSPGISAWSSSEDAIVGKSNSTDDAIEQLKKEIRGVKGVLLSARRFPPAASRAVPA